MLFFHFVLGCKEGERGSIRIKMLFLFFIVFLVTKKTLLLEPLNSRVFFSLGMTV